MMSKITHCNKKKMKGKRIPESPNIVTQKLIVKFIIP
jgi:hypothetical protein